MSSLPYPEQQQYNPFCRPDWRWSRATDLIASGKYFSAKRDDAPTGIAVAYLRETNRCLSELRQKRVKERFLHVAQAHRIWQSAGATRLKIEARILARQADVEIGWEMNLPAATIQAYSDLYYDVRSRIESMSYIAFQVIGVHPRRVPTAVQLMRMCSYEHGPLVIGPWFEYLRDGSTSSDLTSTAGRMAASISLLVETQSLPDDDSARMSLLRRLPFLLKNKWKSTTAVTATSAFRKSTDAIIDGLDLPPAELAPYSYAPGATTSADRTPQRKNRKAA